MEGRVRVVAIGIKKWKNNLRGSFLCRGHSMFECPVVWVTMSLSRNWNSFSVVETLWMAKGKRWILVGHGRELELDSVNSVKPLKCLKYGVMWSEFVLIILLWLWQALGSPLRHWNSNQIHKLNQESKSRGSSWSHYKMSGQILLHYFGSSLGRCRKCLFWPLELMTLVSKTSHSSHRLPISVSQDGKRFWGWRQWGEKNRTSVPFVSSQQCYFLPATATQWCLGLPRQENWRARDLATLAVMISSHRPGGR